MFVGHSLLAFAAVAVVASRWLDASPRRALSLGAFAGAFAAVPDADMAYALSGVLDVVLAAASGDGTLAAATVDSSGVFAVTGAFWAASTVVHRSMTHSLVVAPVAAAAFGLLAHRGSRARVAAAAGSGALVLVALAAIATVLHGALGLLVFGAFAAAGAGVAVVVRHWTTLDSVETTALALVGLASHPFGDLFTGEPPAFLWPLSATSLDASGLGAAAFDGPVLDARVALAADPTLHLLGAFALELAVIALAFVVYADVADHHLRIAPRSVAGLGYGTAVLVVPAPTLDVSYPFVFSILAVGALAATPGVARAGRDVARAVRDATDAHGGVNATAPRTLAADGGRAVRAAHRGVDPERALGALATAVATVAFALAAYAIVYVVVA